MKHTRTTLITLAAFLILIISAQSRAQTGTQPQPSEPVQAQQQPTQATMADMIGQLGLTPEQIQKWRAINQDLREQQQSANLRLRQARRALADAIESPTPNEELVKQRAREVSDAQAATTQLQALREARILQTLTPEQRVKLREIRERNQAQRRANQQQQRNGLGGRQNGLRNNNPNAPLRPNQQRKILRQQKIKR
ncbi:MAG: hypothetical protein DMF71_06055 [Acidobacteria bacterium]|nr:MAG: hypothetical protein DMF71_06055 [Acidobacteriota bacterium]